MGFYVVRKRFLLLVLMIPIIKFVSTLDTNIKELLPVKSEEKSKLALEEISTNEAVFTTTKKSGSSSCGDENDNYWWCGFGMGSSSEDCNDQNPTVPPTRAPTAKPSISRPPTVKPSTSGNC